MIRSTELLAAATTALAHGTPPPRPGGCVTEFVVRCHPANPEWDATFTFGPFTPHTEGPGGSVIVTDLPDLAGEIAAFRRDAAAVGFTRFTVLPRAVGMHVNAPATIAVGTYQPDPKDHDDGGGHD
jgi:hypothetical protein